MMKTYIQDKNTTSLQLAQRLMSIKAELYDMSCRILSGSELDSDTMLKTEIEWIEDEFLERKLKWYCEHPDSVRPEGSMEWAG